MTSKSRTLVVLDGGTGSAELVAALRHRVAWAPESFTLLVPAADGGSAGGWSAAISRAELVSAQARRAGIELEETIVGDPDPSVAVGDAFHARAFDRILAGTGEDGDDRLVVEPLALAA